MLSHFLFTFGLDFKKVTGVIRKQLYMPKVHKLFKYIRNKKDQEWTLVGLLY